MNIFNIYMNKTIEQKQAIIEGLDNFVIKIWFLIIIFVFSFVFLVKKKLILLGGKKHRKKNIFNVWTKA